MSTRRQGLETMLRRLVSRAGRGARLRLSRVRRALEQLDRPHQELAVVHVAGTNGKGSVCAMVEATARAAGLRTGLYTSPHLNRFNERIRFDGWPVGDDELAGALERVMGHHLPQLTFFETMTVAAFVAMRARAVDLAVVEVGLGGRLDATNVVDEPLCTAITTIGEDHVALLGTNLASIAAEKAGILKERAPLVVGPVAPPAWRAIRRIAERVRAGPCWRVLAGPAAPPPPLATGRWIRRADGVPVWPVWTEVEPGGRTTVTGPEGRSLRAQLSLAGAHQAANAAVATAIAWQLGEHFPAMPEQARRALATVRWPGRLERLQLGPVSVILDGAHNAPAAEQLARTLAPELDPTRTTLIFGAMSDKAWAPVLAPLAALAARRLYTEPLRPVAGRSSADPRALARLAPGRWVGEPRFTIRYALAQALPGETILVAGSIFLAGAVRAALLGLKEDAVLPL